MSRLDQREQRFSYAAAAFGALASAGLWAPAFDETAGIVLAAIGVAMAGLLALAARRGSRLLTGLAAVLLAFGPWGMAWILGFPFLCLAAWLLFRGGRLAAETRAARPPEPKREPKKKPEAPSARPSRPEANKRYTPPQRRQ